MDLTPGTRVGSYEISSQLGAGGMGVVYRARDTKLQRDVALKVLPDHLANDPDRLARFQREAQVLASLNHPNIAAIYGLEEADGVRALVLELVEGPTLADRIVQGAVPLDEALPIARQIAKALEGAHEHSIVHRDLKPANIKVRPDGTVKVLDFGLAKLVASDTGAPPGTNGLADLSHLPTVTSPAAASRMGVIMGTAAYMSPEQARGKSVDKRTDIWAFGCVLYEMLTGKMTFAGADGSQVLGRVIEREPDFSALPSSTPESLRRLLRRCLQKERTDRLPDIGVARLEIGEAHIEIRRAPTCSAAGSTALAPAVTQPAARREAPLVGAAMAGGLIVAAAMWILWPDPARSLARFVITASPSAPMVVSPRATDLTISPEGTRIVYTSGSPPQLYVRGLDQLQGTLLGGTNYALNPFFSPDGNWVAFSDPGSLKKISVLGASVPGEYTAFALDHRGGRAILVDSCTRPPARSL